ncbi:MAG: hypothetical protein JKY20_09255 [Alphaproteobacteria bacterium]|nr:hypothetical protein [Alphaproteobacteria bacterium]
MLKKNLGGVIAALLVVGVPGQAFAEKKMMETNIGDFSANVSLYSDYIYRGISQTFEEPSIQGGADWSHDSGFYAGAWASNVDFNDGDQAHIEIDVYAGYGGSIGNFGYDIGILQYLYPGASSSLSYDFWEVTPSISYDFGVASVGASISYTPDNFGGSDEAFFYQATIEAPLPKGFTISANIGRWNIEDNATFALPDYTTWGVGLNYGLGSLNSKLEAFSIGVDYTDTNIDRSVCGSDNCDGRAVFNISASF